MKSLSSLNFSMSGVVARLLGLSLTVHGNLPVFKSASVPLGPPPLPLRWWWILMGDVGELGEGGTLSGLRLRAKNGRGPRRPPKRSPCDAGDMGFWGTMIGVGGPFFRATGDLGRPGSHWLNTLPIPGTGGGDVAVGEVARDVAAVETE